MYTVFEKKIAWRDKKTTGTGTNNEAQCVLH